MEESGAAGPPPALEVGPDDPDGPVYERIGCDTPDNWSTRYAGCIGTAAHNEMITVAQRLTAECRENFGRLIVLSGAPGMQPFPAPLLGQRAPTTAVARHWAAVGRRALMCDCDLGTTTGAWRALPADDFAAADDAGAGAAAVFPSTAAIYHTLCRATTRIAADIDHMFACLERQPSLYEVHAPDCQCYCALPLTKSQHILTRQEFAAALRVVYTVIMAMEHACAQFVVRTTVLPEVRDLDALVTCTAPYFRCSFGTKMSKTQWSVDQRSFCPRAATAWRGMKPDPDVDDPGLIVGTTGAWGSPACAEHEVGGWHIVDTAFPHTPDCNRLEQAALREARRELSIPSVRNDVRAAEQSRACKLRWKRRIAARRVTVHLVVKQHCGTAIPNGIINAILAAVEAGDGSQPGIGSLVTRSGGVCGRACGRVCECM